VNRRSGRVMHVDEIALDLVAGLADHDGSRDDLPFGIRTAFGIGSPAPRPRSFPVLFGFRPTPPSLLGGQFRIGQIFAG
jgi:hypothetical protein